MVTRTKRGAALLPDDLDLEDLRAAPGAGKPQPPFHERPPPPADPVPAATDGRHIKERAVATTLYLLPSDHIRLKVLAAKRGVSMQTLTLDALDLLLLREMENPVGRWDTRRKAR